MRRFDLVELQRAATTHPALPHPPIVEERKRIRQQAGVSRAEVAVAIGASVQSIEKLETGRGGTRVAASSAYRRVMSFLAAHPLHDQTKTTETASA